MTDRTSNCWTKLTKFPSPYWHSSEIIKINRNEFVRFSDGKTFAHKYNIIGNKWNKLEFEMPDDTNFNNDVISAFDQKTQILYIYTAQQMITINLKRNETKITKNVRDIGHSGRGIIINGKFHIIGGLENADHLIWNGNEFESVFSFTDKTYFSQSGIAHISSKQTLICIAGFVDMYGRVDWIYSYNTECRKWTKLPQKVPVTSLWIFGCIVSRDQKHVIILGGDWTIDTIYVLDVKTMKFRKSSIVCPKKGYFQAINMNDRDKDDLLSFGYIRNMWHCPQFNDMLFPPYYLIKMISSYYSNEWIYLMEQQTGEHWKIKLDDILTN